MLCNLFVEHSKFRCAVCTSVITTFSIHFEFRRGEPVGEGERGRPFPLASLVQVVLESARISKVTSDPTYAVSSLGLVLGILLAFSVCFSFARSSFCVLVGKSASQRGKGMEGKDQRTTLGSFSPASHERHSGYTEHERLRAARTWSTRRLTYNQNHKVRLTATSRRRHGCSTTAAKNALELVVVKL